MVAGAAAILDPDAEAHPARLMTLRRASGTLPIAEAFDDLVEPLCKVAVNAAVAQSKRLAQGKQILATKIIGVDPQSPRDHVDLRFRRKARLGSAKAAKRPGRNRVGANRISARRDCVPTIGTGDAVSGLDHRQRARVRIGAAVVSTKIPACLVSVSKLSSRLRQRRTGRPAFIASSTTSGSILQKLLPPKPPPT